MLDTTLRRCSAAPAYGADYTVRRVRNNGEIK